VPGAPRARKQSNFFILRVVDPAAARIMHQNMPFSDEKKLKNSSGKLNPFLEKMYVFHSFSTLNLKIKLHV